MSRRNGWMLAVASALACGTLSGAANAAPVISIGGLTGAEHWVWHEGEDDFSAPNAGTDVYRNNSGVSGWMANGPDNAYERTTGSSNVRTVAWTIHTPAAMSSSAKIYARASINSNDVDMTITVGASTVATEMVNSGQTNPTVFLEHKVGGTSVGRGVTVGPLTAGSQNVSYAAAPYNATTNPHSSFMVDGVLIYDGTPVLPTGLSTGDRRWLLNPSSADSPELPDPLAPILNVTGLADGNVVQYLLNGEAYTPGTEIGPGDYELVVAVWQDSSATSKRLAFAGANFKVVPEPASLLLVAGGVLAIGLRRGSR